MRSLSTGQTDSLVEILSVRRGMMLIELEGKNYGVWDGNEPLVWNTFTFNGGGRFIEVEGGTESKGLSAEDFSIKLYAVPDSELTPEILYTVQSENYYNRPITIWTALFNADTGLRIDEPILQKRGLIQKVENIEDGTQSYIYVEVKSSNHENTETNNTMANAAHHAFVSPTDRIFEYVGSVSGAINFGRPTPADWKPSNRTEI